MIASIDLMCTLVSSNCFISAFIVCANCSIDLMSALVSCNSLLVIQIETDVYFMLRKVVECLLFMFSLCLLDLS